MNRAKQLGTGVYISVQEAAPAALLVLCSFFKTFAVAAMDAGSSVLFLNAYAGHYIAQTFVATAVALAVLWPALASLRGRKTAAPALVSAAAAVAGLVLYAAVSLSSAGAPRACAMVFKDAFRVVAETAFWIAAFRYGLFNAKMKTLTAVLGAQALAAFAAGAFIRGFAPETSVLAASLAVLTAAALLKVLIDNGSAPIAEKIAVKKRQIRRSGYDSTQKKLYRRFYVLAGVLFFAAGVFNYYFLNITALTFDGQTVQMARTFGGVYALSGVLTAAFIALAAKGAVSVFTVLYLFPVILLTAAAGGWFAAFPLIVAGKALLELTAGEARETALQTVPLAVSLRSGFRATVIRKSAVEPLALALCGAFLWYAESHITEQRLICFMAALAAVVLIVICAARATYLRLVLNQLESHLWRGGRLILTGKRIKKYLKSRLDGRDSQEALYALRVIEESRSPLFIKSLKLALRHENADVRLYALSRIENARLTAAVDFVRDMAETDFSTKVRREAWRILCRLGGGDDRAKAVSLLPDPDLCEGVLPGLLAAGREGVFSAIEHVAALSVSFDAPARCLAAKVLGNAGNQAFYHPLNDLLNDDDPAVCRAALDAAGKLLIVPLLPAVMETFRFPELREDAVAVLMQYGDKALGQIEKVMTDARYPVQFRMLLARVAGKIPSVASEKLLFKHIGIDDRRVRFNVLKSLVLGDFKAAGKNAGAVRLCLYDEIETATGLLAAAAVLDTNKNDAFTRALDILKSALNGEIEYIKERLLLLLALLQPSPAIKELLGRYDTAQDDNGETVKIVDRVLSGELRTLCLPLFEKKTVREKLALLRPHFYPPVLSVAGHVCDILKTPVGELTDWTRACAAFAAGTIKDKMFVDALVVLLTDVDPIVRETAVWAIGEILPRDESARLISGCLTDPCAPVARMARFITDGAGHIAF